MRVCFRPRQRLAVTPAVTNGRLSTIACVLLALGVGLMPSSGSGHHARAGDDLLPGEGVSIAAFPAIAPRVAAHWDDAPVQPAEVRWLPSAVFQHEPAHDHQRVDVPEPLLFDLVRPLGARKGELEFNTLAIFPWSASNTNPDDDPFGPSPTTFDKGGIEWAPEVEYALADNFAIEFEFPFESSTLEEYKLGLQWTIGTAFDNRYIHGFQVLVQPTSDWENWNSTLLYLAGIRFDETWSALIMAGGRMDLEGPDNAGTFERLLNASLFADVNRSARVGLETNYASKLDGTAEFILIPQLHYDFNDHFQVQAGLGFGAFSEGSEQSFILRVICNN